MTVNDKYFNMHFFTQYYCSCDNNVSIPKSNTQNKNKKMAFEQELSMIQ